MKKYYIESRRRGISYLQQKEGGLTGMVTSYVVHRNCPLKHVIES